MCGAMFVGDGVFHRGGDEHVALAGEQFLVGDRVGAGEIGERAVLLVVDAGGVDVDAVFVEDAAAAFR